MLKKNAIAKVVTDDNSRLFKGDTVRIIKYSPTYQGYYVQRTEGTICCMVKEKDIEEVKGV